jgi:mannosyltransferase OCH1-like enzyme
MILFLCFFSVMIPKRIHVIWIQGCDQMPQMYMKRQEANRNLLTEYEFFFWDDVTIRALLLHKFKDVYDKYLSCAINAQRSDIARLCILYEYGGIYTDVDFRIVKNLDIFLDCDLVCVSHNIYGINKIYNGIFGVVAKNQILLQFINSIVGLNNDELNNVYKIPVTTGSIAFYNIIKNNYDHCSVKVINHIYFHPFTSETSVINRRLVKQFVFSYATNYSSWQSPQQLFFSRTMASINKQFQHFNTSNEEQQFLSRKTISVETHSNYENLVVVAHPDDELLWFGSFLINNAKNSTVLCITNASNSTRANEFSNVMRSLGCNFIMWDLKDCKSYNHCDLLKRRLKQIVSKYKNVYTHSLSGETGHPQHILLNMYLYEVVKTNLFVANLNLFKYQLSSDKLNLLRLYKSQYFALLLHLNESAHEDYLQIK